MAGINESGYRVLALSSFVVTPDSRVIALCGVIKPLNYQAFDPLSHPFGAPSPTSGRGDNMAQSPCPDRVNTAQRLQWRNVIS